MFEISIKRARKLKQALDYQEAFYKLSGVKFPIDYILAGKSFLIYNRKKAVGGFIIAKRKNARSIRQIPKTQKGIAAIAMVDRYKWISEMNGYFITDRKLGFFLVTAWLFVVLFDCATHYIYAYESSNENLKKYYSPAKPMIIYDGIVSNLSGMIGVHSERIEIISKIGFLKLYVARLKKQWRLRKWI